MAANAEQEQRKTIARKTEREKGKTAIQADTH
jgi:hypothetical protein